MNKFLLFSLLFVGFLLVLDRSGAWVLDHVYQRIVVGQKGGRVNTYLARPAPPPVLLMGNSRVACNVDPDSLHLGAYSLAHDGTRQIFQTGLLSLLQQTHKLPRVIVLHVDLQEFVSPDHLEDIMNLRYYYGQAPYITEYHNELSRLEPLKFWSSLYRHNGRLFSMAKNWRLQHAHRERNEGYEPTPPSPQDSARTVYSAQEMADEPGHLNRGELRYLQDFIALCQSNHVRLLCFTSPYYQVPPWLPRASALVDSLLRAEGVPYFNLALHPVGGLTGKIRYWRDASHVNTRGIPLLSQGLARHLATELDRPTKSVSVR